MPPTEISLLGLPGLAWLWLLTIPAFGVFGWRVWRLIGLLRQGRYENRFDRPLARLGHALKNVLLQPRIFGEPNIGLPHLLIFWGFVVYAGCFGWALLRGLFPFLPVPFPDEVAVVALFLETFSLLVLVSLAVALARRLFFAPKHLHLSVDANLILALIALLMLTTPLGSGFRLVAEGGARSAWTPGGNLVAAAFAGVPADAAHALSVAMWWLHIAVVLFFLVYLPYSKHLHLLASPFNVYFSGAVDRAPGMLDTPGARDDMTAGASKWEELTWKQLLAGFSCAECGRCDRACPAATAGYPLLPQQIVQKIKAHMLATGLGRRSGTGQSGSAALAERRDASPGEAGAPREHLHPRLVGDVIGAGELWACTTCLACMERCAVWNEQVPLIVSLRRHLVSEGAVDRGIQDVLANLTRYGNSFGKSDRMRARWVQSSGLKIKDARKEAVEFLWFVGDTASFDPGCEAITKRTAKVFAQAGVDFGLLYDGERNSGNDVRRIGEEGLFEMLRDKNQQALAKARFKAIVTTDPHSYNALKHEYGWNGGGPRVVHFVELVDELMQAGKLSLRRQLAGRVTYQDPCYLGRYNAVYDAPRRVLAGLGLELVEMPRHRGRSWCCGAGGGRLWMEDAEKVAERPAENRIREAVALEGVRTLVVACPKDVAMFRDAIKTTGHEGRIEVKEIAELVADAMEPAEESARSVRSA